MNRTNCTSIFKKWLQSQAHRFNGHEPLYTGKTKNGSAMYRFKGVTKHLTLIIMSDGGCVVSVDRLRTNFDHFAFDVYPEKTTAGRYFSSLRIPRYRRHYKSLEQLFINEACEYLVKWANEKFIKSNRLMIVGMRGSSWAKILSPSALKLKANRRDPDYNIYELVNVLFSKSSKVNNGQKKS